jgi:hypothetical protein
MSKNIDQLAPTKSLIDLSRYTSDEFTLPDQTVTKLFDDLILAEFIDVSQDGTAIKRGDIYVPLNTAPKAWRVGTVLMKGGNCSNVELGDQIIFPSDKGVPVSGLTYTDKDGNTQTVKYGIFLNEERLFGACTPNDQ